MKKLICVAAIAAPLLIACDKKCEESAADGPARITDVPKDTAMTGRREWTPQQLEANEKALKDFIKDRKAKTQGAAAAATTHTTGNPWDEVLKQEWPINYLHCKLPGGTPVPDSKCHLYVDEKQTPPTPVRYIRVGRISDTEYWAIVRSADPKLANEFMYCGYLKQKDPGTPSFLKGECTMWPHDTNNPVHLVDMSVELSSLGKYTSIFFEFSDGPAGPLQEVHNGDAHGGDD
jgi:hypothetical protein